MEVCRRMEGLGKLKRSLRHGVLESCVSQEVLWHWF